MEELVEVHLIFLEGGVWFLLLLLFVCCFGFFLFVGSFL